MTLIENKGRFYNLDAVQFFEEFSELPDPNSHWETVMTPVSGFRLFLAGMPPLEILDSDCPSLRGYLADHKLKTMGE